MEVAIVFGGVKVKVRTDTAESTNVMIAGLRQCRDLIGKEKMFVKYEDKVASRLSSVYLIFEELWIFESCCLSPIRRNSVLEELRDKRSRKWSVWQHSGGERCLPESLRDERREKVKCHQHRGGDIVTEMKWEYCEELYTLWRTMDREQSLEERHTVRCVRKRSSRYIKALISLEILLF